MKPLLPCRRVDPEIFFPVGDTGPAILQAELAKDFCHSCPIERECLDYALERGIDYGIWGGTTEKERRQMRAANHRVTARRIDANTTERHRLVAELAS